MNVTIADLDTARLQQALDLARVELARLQGLIDEIAATQPDEWLTVEQVAKKLQLGRTTAYGRFDGNDRVRNSAAHKLCCCVSGM